MQTLDDLITALNTNTNIPFTKDAWVEVDTSSDYGVVTATGAPMALWGDDRIQAQVMYFNVYLYSMDGSDETMTTIQNELDNFDIGYSLPAREYLQDINAIRWTWTCNAIILPTVVSTSGTASV